MQAYIKNNEVLIINTERKSERPIFDLLVKEFKSNDDVTIKCKIMGPSEDVVEAEYKGDKILLWYDIDYELWPIKCGKKSIDYVFETVQKIIDEMQ